MLTREREDGRAHGHVMMVVGLGALKGSWLWPCLSHCLRKTYHETSTYYTCQGQNGTWETTTREPKEMKFEFSDYYRAAFTDSVMEQCWTGV